MSKNPQGKTIFKALTFTEIDGQKVVFDDCVYETFVILYNVNIKIWYRLK
jgi:hypothetical protein